MILFFICLSLSIKLYILWLKQSFVLCFAQTSTVDLCHGALILWLNKLGEEWVKYISKVTEWRWNTICKCWEVNSLTDTLSRKMTGVDERGDRHGVLWKEEMDYGSREKGGLEEACNHSSTEKVPWKLEEVLGLTVGPCSCSFKLEAWSAYSLHVFFPKAQKERADGYL